MPRIRFDAVATIRLTLAPGDEIVVEQISEELTRLLNATRVDGSRVAHVVRGRTSEETPSPRVDEETASIRTRSTRSPAA